MADEAERVLPLFPLEQVVLFPGMSLPLRIFEERYKVMIGACQVTDQLFGVVLIRTGREVGDPAEPEHVGCTARMVRVDRIPDGQIHILTVGEQRFRLIGSARVMPEGYLVGDVQLLGDPPATVDASLMAAVGQQFTRYQQAVLGMTGRGDPVRAMELPKDPARLSYRIASTLFVDPQERQKLLELDDAAARLRAELALLEREMPKTIGPFSLN
ncbi:MAG: LON peptidase substrate-binding domain-containing protein [Chloroflexi bacterium]|nr:LON peptidase substrate-binding domain-containing protein [Chloroflexota bacterium]MBV9896033.1 LON peptidase substrate-binding domain-containing protein [Chloroflexota bacterium]